MSDPRPVVTVLGGALQGTTEHGLAVFRGVPYAAPPVGEARWMAARTHPGWSGLRDASRYGATAPQPYAPGGSPIMGSNGEPPFGEDCLTLNIWSPDTGGDLPVMVWVHGGGYLAGSGNLEFYGGATTARHGNLVHVAINYRLGALGYLHGMGDSANLWLTDQVMALRWISDNIAAFGGDPSRVTMVGQSGGAFSIGALAGHPASAPLFQRGFLMSPPLGVALPTGDEAFKRTESLARTLGHTSTEALRDESWERLVGATMSIVREYEEFGEWGLAFLPVIDDSTMPLHPSESLARSSIDLVLGVTRDEATCAFLFRDDLDSTTRDDVVAWLGKRHGSNAPALYDAYARLRPWATPKRILTDALTDDLFRRETVALAERRSATAPVRLYQFEVESPLADGALGATHSLDMAFVLGNFEAWGPSPFLQGFDRKLRDRVSRVLHQALIDVVTGTDPTAGSTPWPVYDLPERSAFVVDRAPSVRPGDDWLGALKP